MQSVPRYVALTLGFLLALPAGAATAGAPEKVTIAGLSQPVEILKDAGASRIFTPRMRRTCSSPRATTSRTTGCSSWSCGGGRPPARSRRFWAGRSSSATSATACLCFAAI